MYFLNSAIDMLSVVRLVVDPLPEGVYFLVVLGFLVECFPYFWDEVVGISLAFIILLTKLPILGDLAYFLRVFLAFRDLETTTSIEAAG